MHGLRTEVHHRNQPNKIKLAVYKPLLSFCGYKYQTHVQQFIYKGEYDVCMYEVKCVSRHLKEELAWVITIDKLF